MLQNKSMADIARGIERYEIPPLIEKIAAFGRRGKVDRVWVPLHSPTTIRVAEPVARALGVPLIVTVWDPPNYKLRQFGLAPPPKHNGDLISVAFLDVAVCPRCSSTNTVIKNSFGPTLCRMIRYCNDCQDAFEQFKPL